MHSMIKHSLVILVTGLLLGMVTPGQAGDSLLPEIPAAQARFSETQGCVEPTAEMRRNHMEYILHQRDETMHHGVRTRQYSLVECINCHVSDAPDAPRVSSKEHFCSSCHSYAAVSIDCFQCHADRPVKTSGMRVMPAVADSGGARAAGGGSPAIPVLANEDMTHE
jgi:hypothetical protein